MENLHGLAQDDEQQHGRLLTIELRVQRIYLEESILIEGTPNRVDPDKWRPLIMSFQQFYGLSEKVNSSALSTIPEYLYRSPDIDRANTLTVLGD